MEWSRQILSPQDQNCSFYWGALSFSLLLWQFCKWIRHFFLVPFESYLLSILGFGIGASSAVPINIWIFSWTILEKPLVLRWLSNTQFICKLLSKIKGFVFANVDFVLHTPNRFLIYSSSIQHLVENYHCPTTWFRRCSKKVVHLDDYVRATFSKVIKLKYLWLEFIIIFGTSIHWSHCRKNHEMLFPFDFVVTVYDVMHMSFFFFVMTCHTESFPSFCIK